MRLFVAIELEEPVKELLSQAILRLEGHALRASSTRRENLHLTLAFLGECEKVDGVKSAIARVGGGPVELILEGLGSYRQKGGDCYWMGVEATQPLKALHLALVTQLRREGIPLEERTFRPHITLTRRVLMADSFDCGSLSRSLPPMGMTAKAITLFRSQQIGGRCVYTPLYRHSL